MADSRLMEMFSHQKTGSLCIGDQSRFPENISALYLSKELSLRILSFRAASTTSNACDKSCSNKHPYNEEAWTQNPKSLLEIGGASNV
jgi:hypothetical protein